METKKKRLGTKAQIRAEKERERKIATTIFLASILLVAVFSTYFTYNNLNQPAQTTSLTSQFKAAIVDQGSLSPVAGPNPDFIETTTNILRQAGYTTDYYSGEKVTVEFYRNLPTHGYSIIILRVHSSAAALEGKEYVEFPVSLFTSEKYTSTKYVWEQSTDQLVIASFSMPQPPYYFAITPEFVTSSMNGKFQNSIIVMMGCEGVSNTKMAEAFIKKGAKTYISWNKSVSVSHTDLATTHLLQHLITERQTIKQAVNITMEEVGPNPIDNSILLYYPIESGNFVIPG
jgi:hypothetical protein